MRWLVLFFVLLYVLWMPIIASGGEGEGVILDHFIINPTPTHFMIMGEGKTILLITNDGRVEYDGDPSEAAKAFIEMVRGHLANMKLVRPRC